MPTRLTALAITPIQYGPTEPVPPVDITVNFVTESLFLRSLNRFWELVTKFTKENHKLHGFPPLGTEGFQFEGQPYRSPEGTITKGGILPPLHSTLEEQFKRIMQNEEKAEDSKGRIRRFLVVLLMPCESWQDMRDALPESLIDLVPKLTQLKRTRPEGFTMLDDKHKLISYNNHKEIIDLHSGIRMLT